MLRLQYTMTFSVMVFFLPFASFTVRFIMRNLYLKSLLTSVKPSSEYAHSCSSAALVLNKEKIPTINGCTWTTKDIRRIPQNEKYAGNMLLQKSYRENHITKKCLKNNGELPQFYVEESHPAIIEPQIFALVQGLIKRRSRHFTPPKSSNQNSSKAAHCNFCLAGKYRKTQGCWLRKSIHRFWGTADFLRCTGQLLHGLYSETPRLGICWCVHGWGYFCDKHSTPWRL